MRRLAALGAMLVASHACATIVVYPLIPGSGTLTVTPSGPSNENVHIVATASGLEFSIVIEVADGRQDIGVVTIEANGPSNSRIIVNVQPIAYPQTRNIVSIVPSNPPGSAELWINNLAVSGSIGGATSPFGTIRANLIASVAAGGSIRAAVEGTGTMVSGQGPTINQISATGDILGPITAQRGTIGTIAAGGNIGDMAGSAVAITGFDSIGRVEARAIHADIGLDGGGNGVMGALEATHGDFKGALVCKSLSDAIEIKDDLDANITILGSAPTQVPIRIGGSLESGRRIWIRQDLGLANQILINRANDGSTWSGEVAVGTDGADPRFILNTPEYTTTAAALGGGSVGTVRYGLHDESCVPQNGASQALYTIDPLSMEEPAPCVLQPLSFRVRFYGPVEILEGHTGLPLIIERQNPINQQWINETSQFTTTFDGDRELVVNRTAGSWQLATYRARPAMHSVFTQEFALRCKDTDVAGAARAPEVANFTYTFSLYDDCAVDMLRAYDVNEDETLSGADASAWAAGPSDLNGDQAVTAQDLVDLYEAIDQFHAPRP